MSVQTAHTKKLNPIIAEDLLFIAGSELPWLRLKNKTLMITGGNGFIASNLIQAILYANHIHNLNLKIISIIRGTKKGDKLEYLDDDALTIIKHDVTDPMPDHLPMANFVIHAASQASPKYYGSDPVGTLKANTIGTMNLLAYATKSGAERFQFFSSGEVYGFNKEFSARLVNESDFGYLDPTNLRSCYAESKRMGENMCVSWAAQYGLSTVIVRPFHTYGPGMALDDGRVFADFVECVINKKNISLNSNGLALRPFCYIRDAVIGFLTILFNGESSMAYNIGNPNAEISISDLANCIVNLFPEIGIKVERGEEIQKGGYIASQTPRSSPDISRAIELGWLPSIKIEEGFRRTIQYYLNEKI